MPVKNIISTIFEDLHELYKVKIDNKLYIHNLTIETNYYCNSRCSFCERWKEPVKDYLSLEDYKRLFEEIKGKVRRIVLTGGEPLLRKDIFEIAKEAKKTGAKIELCSNGLLVKYLADKIKDSGIDHVMISLESHIPEIHDKLRGIQGSWKKAVEGIKELKKLGVSVSTQCVITKENIKQINEWYDWVRKELGIIGLAQPLHDTPINLLKVNREEIKFTSEDKKIIEKELTKLEEKTKGLDKVYYRLAKYFFLNPKELLKIKCIIAGKHIFFIDPKGDVYPCEPRRDWKLGNIKEQRFTEIYNSKKRKEFLEYLEKNPCVCMFACTMPFNVKYGRLPWSFILRSFLPDFCQKSLIKKFIK